MMISGLEQSITSECPEPRSLTNLKHLDSKRAKLESETKYLIVGGEQLSLKGFKDDLMAYRR